MNKCVARIKKRTQKQLFKRKRWIYTGPGRPDEFVKKIAQYVAQPIIFRNQYITGTVEKSSPEMCATFVIFKPLP
jgi:hypothetical protein